MASSSNEITNEVGVTREQMMRNRIIAPIDIMIDIETMSTEPTALIWQIGAVNIRTKEHVVHTIKADDSYWEGYNVSHDTRQWQLLFNPINYCKSLALEFAPTPSVRFNAMLKALIDFIRAESLRDNPAHLWSKGKEFDFPILEYAMRHQGFAYPWKYWQKHDFRDLADAMGQPMKLDNVAHNALEDAERQGAHLLNLLDQLRSLPNYGIQPD